MRKRLKLILRNRIFCLMGLLVIASPIYPAQGGLLPSLEKNGWEEIIFDDKLPNRYDTCGEDCIEIKTDSSVSMIRKPVSINLAQLPFVTWEWKIGAPVAVSDLTAKGRDDRAVAVYFTFPYDPETATFSEKLLRPFIELMRGEAAPGRMLSYVWGGFGKLGDMIKSPYFGDISSMIISRTQADPVGKWVMERFDIVADHKRAFGTTPLKVSNVLLSADSDDIGIGTQAYVRNIIFAAQ
jgi:hypothetical protein